MKIIDITVPLSPDLPVYPGDPPFSLEPVARVARGDGANVSRITLGTHAGTHIDVPRHLRDDGASVDQVPLDLLTGKARVLELRDVTAIGRRELAHLPVKGEERIILKTANSRLWSHAGFRDSYASLTPDGARYLAEAGTRLVGIDYLSIGPFGNETEVHRILLDAGILILEGLNLIGVEPGHYELLCLPLKIAGGDGAPARALLRSFARVPAGESSFDPHTTRWPLS
ncbi:MULTISPECIES: cyclase family protein [Geobacter]|uniref:cyclase family protein n=1 Tax=Geobacter TaxID=28231 RepID=UPI0005DA17CA|nr:cyclase family protein [Geobacter sulfurreducens]AJY69575.1 cyclase [Geobacter sulfurreducens]BEH11883.1 cyclase family protein [Geobacter sulfurreducens subsp. ethanolicus]BET59747.1 cyclase family protein [Geobacter sp. 60473]HML77156.1 cyclase family protein [Geobacter sulfurreducens]